jgi:hypothetical protein
MTDLSSGNSSTMFEWMTTTLCHFLALIAAAVSLGVKTGSFQFQQAAGCLRRLGSGENSIPQEVQMDDAMLIANGSIYGKRSYDEWWLAPLITLVMIGWVRVALDASGVLPMF